MIDDHLILRQFMLADAPLTAAVGDRIHAGRDVPPEGYRPGSSGACVVFKRRSDGPLNESGMVISGSYQVKAYGGASNTNQQILSAEQVYRLLYDALNFKFNYSILGIQKEGGTETLPEPDLNGWPFTLSFWRVQFRKTA